MLYQKFVLSRRDNTKELMTLYYYTLFFTYVKLHNMTPLIWEGIKMTDTLITI